MAQMLQSVKIVAHDVHIFTVFVAFIVVFCVWHNHRFAV